MYLNILLEQDCEIFTACLCLTKNSIMYKIEKKSFCKYAGKLETFFYVLSECYVVKNKRKEPEIPCNAKSVPVIFYISYNYLIFFFKKKLCFMYINRLYFFVKTYDNILL